MKLGYTVCSAVVQMAFKCSCVSSVPGHGGIACIFEGIQGNDWDLYEVHLHGCVGNDHGHLHAINILQD